FEPNRLAGHLAEGPARRCVDAKHRRKADHPFIANRPRFNGAAVLQLGEDRNNPILWKVHVIDPSAWFVDRLFEAERHLVEVWSQSVVVVSVEPHQDLIAAVSFGAG